MFDKNLQLQQLVSLFLEKNTHINLSAIRDEEGVWTKHIEDSLVTLELLQKFVQSAKYIHTSGDISSPSDSVSHISQTPSIAKLARDNRRLEILDLGTGGGFPGLPLAIMFPEVHFTLLDATRKKIDCVREFSEKLDLHNVTPVWGRAEELHSSKINSQFDLIVTRATAYIDDLFTWIVPLMQSDGRAWLYKQASDEEWEDGQKIAKKLGYSLEKILIYELAGQERWILEIRKK